MNRKKLINERGDFLKIKTLKVVTLLFFLCFVLAFGISNVNAIEGETRVLITSKNQNGVFHYGSSDKVEILSEYTTRYSEMRGVWVATAWNIAFSKQESTSDEAIEKYKQEFRTILDRMDEFGMNTIFFQVRPSNDAFYQSELNAWSEFLVGAGIDPGWDPLEWMVEETHKRGYSFMCWMNAFRVTTSTYISDGTKGTAISTTKALEMKKQALQTLADGNFAKEHPEYVLAGSYDEKLILNPSEPAVQKFVVDTVMEIVENYDVDGLHFDDYFYLNGYTSSETSNTNFVGRDAYFESGDAILNDWPNYYEYQKDPANYGKDAFSDFGENAIYGMDEGLTLGDFRRENINIMMRNIRAQIDIYNEKTGDNVEFGTKPAAVWRSNSEFCSVGSDRCSENGSATAEGAYSTYSDLYADSLTWVEEGLVDWVAPQVYYAFEDQYAPYADVVDWWASQIERINKTRIAEGLDPIMLYIAHGIYKYRDAPNQFYRNTEITDQIRYNQHYDCITGSAVYSYENLFETLGSDITDSYPYAENIRSGAMKYFKNLWGTRDVYPLEVGSNDSKGLKLSNYSLKLNSDNTYTLTFEVIENARAYGIYKIEEGVTFDKTNVSNRLGVVYAGYEEGKKIQVELGEIADYYIVPVSLNGYVSDEVTKLDLSTAIPNVAPTMVDINLDNYTGDYKAGSIITGSFKIEDLNADNVTYTFKIIEGSRERTLSLKDSDIVETNSIVTFKWESYAYEAANCKIKVVLSDGYLTTEIFSKEFALVEWVTPEKSIITLDKTSYLSGEQIIIEYTPITNIDSGYLTLNAYLVVEENKIDITNDLNKAIDNKFTIEVPKVYSDNCMIEIIATNVSKTTISTSDKFKILLAPIPDGSSINLNKVEYQIGDTLTGSITLINEDLSYELYFINGETRTKVEVNSDYTFTLDEFNELIDGGYFELVLNDGIQNKSVESEKISVKISVKIVENTDKNNNNSTKEKGCKACNKNSLVVIVSLNLMMTSFLMILRKKYHK